ncbi:MAG: hypothetical protein AAF907_03435, partial [Planctomycetota bacterium]
MARALAACAALASAGPISGCRSAAERFLVGDPSPAAEIADFDEENATGGFVSVRFAGFTDETPELVSEPAPLAATSGEHEVPVLDNGSVH